MASREQQLHVLLIEDNPADARLIREVLADSGEAAFDVSCAERLDTGLAELEGGGVDIVLLDLSLPDSLGLGTFTTVHDHAPDVPIVVISGLNHAGLAREAVREGAHDYLVKADVGDGALAGAILSAIEQHRLRTVVEQSRQRDRQVWAQAEQARSIVLEEIAAAAADEGPSPSDELLAEHRPHYRELLLGYIQGLQGSQPPPAEPIEALARDLAAIRASGAHAVRLHTQTMGDLAASQRNDPDFVANARLVLVELLAALVNVYREA